LECRAKHKTIRNTWERDNQHKAWATNNDRRLIIGPKTSQIKFSYTTTKQKATRLAIYLQREISNHVDKPLTRVHFQKKMWQLGIHHQHCNNKYNSHYTPEWNWYRHKGIAYTKGAVQLSKHSNKVLNFN